MKGYTRVLTLLLMISIADCGGSGESIPTRGASSEELQSSALAIAPTAPGIAVVRSASAMASDRAPMHINAGGPAYESWSADKDYTGGDIALVGNAIDTTGVQDPAPQVVYQSQRYAKMLSYSVPGLVSNGAYTVRLHFVESWFTGPRKRKFNVAVNGLRVLTNFDIFAAAGGQNRVVVKSFTTVADSSGTIALEYFATLNNATVAAIEIIAAPDSANPTTAPTPAASPTGTPFPASGKVMSGAVNSSLATWNSWLGHSTQLVGVYNNVAASTWSSLDDIGWIVSTYPAGTPMIWSLATYPTSSNLASVAHGAGDEYYSKWAAQILANAAPAPDGNYYIRPNWEVPASWFSWGSQCATSPANCILAYQRIASVFHATSPKFKMVWDVIPVFGIALDNSIYYPGDSFVDVVSQDLYLDTSGSNSPAGQWTYGLQRANGLNWLAAFAAEHKKRIATTEWGVNSNTAGPLVTDFENWLSENQAVYQIYFDMGNTRLSNNQYPASGEIVKRSF